MTKTVCKLIGCKFNPYSVCERCGTHVYDGAVTKYDSMASHLKDWLLSLRIVRAARLLKRKTVGKKCVECGRRFWSGYGDEHCSSECQNNWIPF